MFTRLLSRRIDDVSRRPAPAIPIPPPPVSPQSVFPMAAGRLLVGVAGEALALTANVGVARCSGRTN
jgi:hypothetical protein